MIILMCENNFTTTRSLWEFTDIIMKNELANLQSAIEDARAEMTQSGISMN